MGLVLGFTLGMLRLGLNIYYGDTVGDGFLYRAIVSHNWLHYEIYLFVLVILTIITVSFFTKPKDPAKIQGLYFGSATAEQRAVTRASWNKWDVINSLIVLSVVIAFYIYFW